MSNDDKLWKHIDGGYTPAPESKKRFELTPRKLLATGVAALALVVGGGIYLAAGPLNHHPHSTPTARGTASASASDTAASQEPALPAPPVKLESWQEAKWEGPTTKSFDTDTARWAIGTIAGTPLASTAESTLYSPAAGYTNDMSKATLADGSPNPRYAFLTSDIFEAQSTLEVEALLNPVYGGWAKYQKPSTNPSGTFDTTIFSNLFSPSYAASQAASPNKSALPVLADWQNNGYGGAGVVESQGGGYWFGTVTGASTTVKWDPKAWSYTFHATYQVQFRAITASGGVATKTGVLKLTFVQSPKKVAEAGGFRVQIAGGSLTVTK